MSLIAHVTILAALLAGRVAAPVAPPPPPVMMVSLVEAPVHLVEAIGGSAAAAPAKAAPPRPNKSPGKATPEPVKPSPSGNGANDAATGTGEVMSGTALGSATAADALPGGECDMARRLQAALRRDALVRAAVAARGLSGSSAILVWDGGWVASPGEDGKGLAAVREAIVWEVAFSPAACRAARVHGPVLFSVSDGGAQTRIAVGAGDWRWGDLVSSR